MCQPNPFRVKFGDERPDESLVFQFLEGKTTYWHQQEQAPLGKTQTMFPILSQEQPLGLPCSSSVATWREERDMASPWQILLFRLKLGLSHSSWNQQQHPRAPTVPRTNPEMAQSSRWESQDPVWEDEKEQPPLEQ